MKPSMRQRIIANVPELDAQGEPITDRYGEPVTVERDSKARVQYKAQTVFNAQGEEKRVNLEIDIPTDFNPPTGTRVKAQTIGGEWVEGDIEAKDEATNLTASKIYYRTVYVNG